MHAISPYSQFVTTKCESLFYVSCITTYYVGGLTVNNRISVPLKIKATSAVYALGALALAIYGFIAYSLVPIVNVIAMTITLYAASSIVVGGELKNLPTVFTISVLSTIISE